MTESSRLLSPNFLFRFSIPLRHVNEAGLPSKGGEGTWELAERHRIPSFCELDGKSGFADVRMGWNRAGLALSLRVQGKRQQPWCRPTKIEDSDGLHLFLDTRDTRNIHRASRFCHYFAFLPLGNEADFESPLAVLRPVLRAKENPKGISPTALKVQSWKNVEGYGLRGWIPAETLTGYDPSEHERLGFTYVVTDRELGWQPFSVGAEFPFTSDPSLWGSLELVDE